MRRLVIVAALAFGLVAPAQAGFDVDDAVSGDAPAELVRVAQTDGPTITVPGRIDTDQDTVDVVGTVAGVGEVTLTANGIPVPVAADGSFRIRQQVPVGRTKFLLVVEDSTGQRAEQRVWVRRTSAMAELGDFGTYHALVIGNNDYQHLPDLKMAVSDAEAVAELLEDKYGFDVQLLRNATRYDIVSALDTLRAELTGNDNLLIYYAGHGSLDVAGDEGFWQPVDAEPDSSANWVRNTTISSTLRAMQAKHVMVVADSCYSGKLTRASGAELRTGTERAAWLQRMAAKRSRTAMVSGGLEPVLDAGGGDHSVFAKAFLDALGSNNEVLDGQSLFDAIKRPVVLNAYQTPDYADIQRAGHAGGDFLFVPVKVEVTVSIEAPAAASSGEAVTAQQEMLFWQSIQNSTDPADFEVYLAQFPKGTFAGLARNRLRKLKETETAAVVPPPTPIPPSEAVQPAVGEYPKTLKPGDVFKDCDVCPEMVVIPTGSFTMGTNDGLSDEWPAHIVPFARSFAVGKFEVTFLEWDACVADGGCRGSRASDQSWGRGTRPVINVNWDDAKEYVSWLSRTSGAEYRLLSEAEWEYAARAGTTTGYYWGDSVGSGNANCNGCGSRWDDKKTAPVGSFAANGFGLHDMLGNVWEWVEDCWNDSYAGAPSDGGAWTTGDCDRRGVRGGSWYEDPRDELSAHRDGHWTDDRDGNGGFRVARTLRPGEIASSSEMQLAAIVPPPEPSFQVEEMDAIFIALKTSNVRSEPTTQSDRIGRLSRDNAVAVTGKVTDRNWYRIEHEGETAYVFGTLIKEVDPGELVAWEKVANTSEQADVERFLKDYPKGHFTERAKDLLAVLVPPPAPEPAATSLEPAVGVYPKTYQAGDTFKDCDQCPEMVVIPAGQFMMGSPSYEKSRDEDEGPQHRVTIRKPFAVGKYEIMFREWDACVTGGGCNGYRPDDEGWGRGNRPVIYVSWDDAQAYLRWLSRKSGQEYRLLSEAEWEHAARAGTTTPFHFGSTISTDQANYDGNYTYASGRKGVYRKKTVSVGSFPSNSFGLHDVHGNVWEWVEDCYNGSYAGAPSDGAVWTTGDCSVRVLRGGSWGYFPSFVRAAIRSSLGTGYRIFIVGFRVARTLP